jgi:hypothetical protein
MNRKIKLHHKLFNQLRKLQSLLEDIGARLGTSAEQPGDMDRVIAIVHRLDIFRTLREE